jgi:hypothetical protein
MLGYVIACPKEITFQSFCLLWVRISDTATWQLKAGTGEPGKTIASSSSVNTFPRQ